MCLKYDVNYTEHVAFVTEEWIAFNNNGDVEISDEHKKILDYFKKNDLFTLTVFNEIKTVFVSGFRLEKLQGCSEMNSKLKVAINILTKLFLTGTVVKKKNCDRCLVDMPKIDESIEKVEGEI